MPQGRKSSRTHRARSVVFHSHLMLCHVGVASSIIAGRGWRHACLTQQCPDNEMHIISASARHF
jgi:hypothetical protein